MSASSVRRMDGWMSEHHHEQVGAMAGLHGPPQVNNPLLYLDPGAYFQERARRWVDETEYISSIPERAEHPAYKEILLMGQQALPFVFREFEQRPTRWVSLLQDLTGEQPVPEQWFGNFTKILELWLKWAQVRGIRW